MQVLPRPPAKNSSLVISGLGLSLFITPSSHLDQEPWATLINFRPSLNEFRQSCAIKPDMAILYFPAGGASLSLIEKLTLYNFPKLLYRPACSRFPAS